MYLRCCSLLRDVIFVQRCYSLFRDVAVCSEILYLFRDVTVCSEMLQSVQRYCSLFRDVTVCCCLLLSAEEACAEGGLISICNHRNHMTPNSGLSLTNHSRYGMILTQLSRLRSSDGSRSVPSTRDRNQRPRIPST